MNKDNFDLATQIKKYAETFVNKYKHQFPNLDYSLKSLNDVDEIFEITKEEYKKTEDPREFIKSEKISFYILHTLKMNYRGDILWNDFTKQPVFIFDDYDYKEFLPYTYVKGIIIEGKKRNSVKYIKKFCKKK